MQRGEHAGKRLDSGRVWNRPANRREDRAASLPPHPPRSRGGLSATTPSSQAIGGGPTPNPSAAQRKTCPSREVFLGRSLSGQETPNNHF